MGLDWNPAKKPRAGHEEEFLELWKIHTSLPTGEERAESEMRFQEISVSAFETLGAPRVGFEKKATQWAREIYKQQNTDLAVDEWVKSLNGFYVLDLLPECDGIPRYSNGEPGGYVERFSFRAQFLRDCEHIIGSSLLDAGYESKLPGATISHGDALLEAAKEFAEQHRVDLTNLDIEDVDSLESQLDMVLCAGRWCQFWGTRDHGLEAYW